MDRFHYRVEPIVRLDQLARAAARAQLGQSAQEPFVDGLVDPQREDADASQPRSDRFEHLILVTHLAVCHQDENAVARSRRKRSLALSASFSGG